MIYLAPSVNAPMGKVLKTSTSRTFFRYWAHIDQEFPPIHARGAGRRLGKDNMFGPKAQKDADQLCADMLHRPGQEPYASTEPTPVYSARNKAVRRPHDELANGVQSLLLRVHKAAPSTREIKAYAICAITDVVLPGPRRKTQSRKMKDTEIKNFRNAVDHVQLPGGLQLNERSQKPTNFPDSALMQNNRHSWHLSPNLWKPIRMARRMRRPLLHRRS